MQAITLVSCDTSEKEGEREKRIEGKAKSVVSDEEYKQTRMEWYYPSFASSLLLLLLLLLTLEHSRSKKTFYHRVSSPSLFDSLRRKQSKNS